MLTVYTEEQRVLWTDFYKGQCEQQHCRLGMGRMSVDTRARLVWMWRARFSIARIQDRLGEEGVIVSRKSIYLLVRKHHHTGLIEDLKRAPHRRQLSNEHFRFIDEAVERNPELTSRQLHSLLCEKFSISASLSTVKRARLALGWGSKRARYCALISEVNKETRMTWCSDCIVEGDIEY